MAKILIVDDAEVDLLLEQAVLARFGHETFTATGGDEALRVCAEQDIEVVVTDLHMPAGHGFELISLLRDFSPRPAIIAVSGTGSAQLEIAHELGALFTLNKPVNPERLVAAVEQALSARAGVAKNQGMGA
ncbi:MAG: response regulator [Gemmatimonadota bacterium]